MTLREESLAMEAYLRVARKKYEQNTGKSIISTNGGARLLAKIITGAKASNRGAWKIVKEYCKDRQQEYLEVYTGMLEKSNQKILKQKEKKKKGVTAIQRDDSLSRFPSVRSPIYSRENAKSFYQSQEWRMLRVDVIEEQHGECQMCGRSHKKHGVVIHVDHIVPLSIDWSRRLDKTNLQLLCEDCNLGKVNHYSTDWRRSKI